MTIAENMAEVKAGIAQAAKAANRNAEATTLVAVSKTKPADAIAEALLTGHRCFGENRVQEAQEKWPDLKAQVSGVELHLIGPLQSNKTEDAVALFDVIETLDRPKLAQALVNCRAKGMELPRLFVQINTGCESQKAGVLPKDADAFLKQCQDEWQLEIAGLMCIPPVGQEPAPHFALLRKIAERNGIKVLSMGMSDDYPVAVSQGASYVRVGSAIFGARNYPTVS